MTSFETLQLPVQPDVVAPDGSDVRILLRTESGSMAHFELAPGRTSLPVAHRTVEEIWYVLSGRAEMWRQAADKEEVTQLEAGTCITIPLGTRFQFSALGPEPFKAVAITMPPWPDADEAFVVDGPWLGSAP